MAKARPKRRILFSKDKMKKIIDALYEGYSLHDIAKLVDMPSLPTLHRWRKQHDDFETAYQQALQHQKDNPAKRQQRLEEAKRNAATAKSKAGRPTTYSQDLAEMILARLEDGQTLKQICEDPIMPGARTVAGWRFEHPDFGKQLESVHYVIADTAVAEVLQIADDSEGDWVETCTPSGETKLNFIPENVQRSKLKVISRQWIAEKYAPKVFGNKITQELTGPAGGPIETNVRLEIISDSDLIQLAREIVFALTLATEASVREAENDD